MYERGAVGFKALRGLRRNPFALREHMTLRILQFGTTGQLATELQRQASAYDVALTALGRADCDLANPEAAALRVLDARPDLVIVAAAYTAVDQAEGEPELAMTITPMRRAPSPRPARQSARR